MWMLAYLFIPGLLGRTISKEWVVQNEQMSPDNYKMNGITINGQFPGPTIECQVGDVIKISVQNALDRNLTIHWHGLAQKGSPDQDGVPYVSQLPIPPLGEFKYKFRVGDQVGTHWYHAHTGVDAELAFGAFIIKDDPDEWKDLVRYDSRYDYDSDCDEVIMLSEMWHKDSQKILHDLTHTPYVSVGNPDSVLINGKGFKTWKDNKPNDKKNTGRHVINVKPNKKCRLRVIGANGHSLIGFTIPHHKFTVIEADGTLVEPVITDHLEINSGQRYSVIIETNQKPWNYYLHAQIIGHDNAPEGIGFLHYEGAPKPEYLLKSEDLEHPLPEPLKFTRWIDPILFTSEWYKKNSRHHYPAPNEVDRDIYLEVHSGFDKTGLPVFKINGKLEQPRDFALFQHTPIEKIRANIPGTYEIFEGENVQVVLQQFSPPNKQCVQHPWHLHGHSFHVVGFGSGMYNKKRDQKKINELLISAAKKGKYPIYRDTFTQYPYNIPSMSPFEIPFTNVTHREGQHHTVKKELHAIEDLRRRSINTESNEAIEGPEVFEDQKDYRVNERGETNCGWVAIRFRADNPGNWIMHCHITAHLIMGKLVTFVERSNSDASRKASYQKLYYSTGSKEEPSEIISM